MNLAEFKIRQLQRYVIVQKNVVVLEVEKIISDTYAGGTTYKGEEFFLLDIYPKKGGTIKITYGDLTKTITDDGTSEEPNAQEVYFGTFNGVSDSVETPSSGTLTIEGSCRGFAISMYDKNKSSSAYCDCVTEIRSFGNIEFIPNNAFMRCTKLTNISKNAFDNCTNFITIGINAFTGCTNLTSIIFPENITFSDGSTLNGIFEDCTSLTSVNIPESVTTIPKYLFRDCTSLTSVNIPESVTSIGMAAFYLSEGNSRKVIMLSSTPPTLDVSVFDVVGTNSIIVPVGCGDLYKAAEYWSEYADYITEATS